MEIIMTDLKETLFLPQTSFPMRGNLPIKEPQLCAKWEAMGLYQKLRAKLKGREKFIIHDGPPYANGNIHIGHAFNKILKDVICRFKQMSGYDAPFVPGWDCHGLPIEWKVEEQYRAAGKTKESINLIEFRQACADFASSWIDIQIAEFKRLGLLADFENKYTTMKPESEAVIVSEIGKFLTGGYLYRAARPVMWSVVEQTALAEAEVEYMDKTSSSVYVAFPMVSPEFKNVHAVIWTTTPWTLPANRAISYGPEIEYVIIEAQGRQFLIAETLKESFTKEYVVIRSVQPSELENKLCAHPLRGKGYDFDVPLIAGDHVTTDAGTGLVHTAPSHGLEDFEVGKKYNLEVPELVLGDGTYAPSVPLFAGKHIFKINPEILEELRSAGALLREDTIVHSYPHSWRSKAPLIYRATPQWFISMGHKDFKKRALEAIKRVEWFPQNSINRIYSMVENRPDWCISRQRYWGVPITVFVNKSTNEPLRDPLVMERVIEAVKSEGIKTWFESPASRFLGDKYDANDYEQVFDVIDVWFESGTTHAFCLEKHPDLHYPASLYLEGSDQHRGWFQSSLLEALVSHDDAPYERVMTHGFVMDEKGRKMSKSLGNVVAPQTVADKQGVDILRLWTIGSDFRDDLRIGPEILKHSEDLYRRLRNTLRYMLGGIDGYTAVEHIDVAHMPELEQWVHHRLFELSALAKETLDTLDFQYFYTQIHHFCSTDLSAFYFDIRKDALYCDNPSSDKRKAVRTTLYTLYQYLVRWLAPVICFTAEEAYLSHETGESVHLEDFKIAPQAWGNEKLKAKWGILRDIRRDVTSKIEIERANKTLGSSLQAHVELEISEDFKEYFESNTDFSEICIVSSMKIIYSKNETNIAISLATGEKCSRCWKIVEDINEEGICGRCNDAVLAYSS
jgi:isoleucyl-tRNA synthetase